MKRILGLCLLGSMLLSAAWAQDETSAPVRPALLVIDIQNEYVPMMDASEVPMATRYVNGALWLFRQHGLPVIRIYHTDPQWGPEPSSEGFQFDEGINIHEDDPKIVKNHPSAFVDTNLDEILKEQGVNTLFLCGLSATGCVLATYFGGTSHGYETFMIEGAIMSPKARHTAAVQEIVQSVGFGALQTILRARTP